MLSGKGNIPIEKEHSNRIVNGKIIKDLPLINHNGNLRPLFSVLPPVCCDRCGSKLYKNKNYTRYLLTSYGILRIPIVYRMCSNNRCKAHFTDTIIGVDGSKNYSEEYLDIQYHTRYEGKCSLHNNRRVGELYTKDGDYRGRAACPTTLWTHEQKQGQISFEELQNTTIPFSGTIHCDGYWVKDGWKKHVEKKLGRELTHKEWKKLRYKVIYVIATEDKVILDFVVTDTQPPYISLIPLFRNVRDRLGEKNITRIVSDEEYAIIDAVKSVLPNATHAFCVFHQLQHLTKIYLKIFKSMDKLPYWDNQFYELGKKMILSKNCIKSTALLTDLHCIIQNPHSEASDNALTYLEKTYKKNRRYLEKGFEPDTNNVMEQLFSFINDFVFQAKSFKREWSLLNWISNLFHIWNHRPFNTGPNRGISPIQIAWSVDPG